MATRKNKMTPAKPQVFELTETWLERRSRDLAVAVGRPAAFLLAFALVIAWFAVGYFMHFDWMWQFVLNTAPAIVTFLMVFLLQRAQNRDTLALQVKLAELIIHMDGAQNKVAMAEHLPDHELEALHEEHTEKAEQEIDRLEEAAAGARKKANSKRR